MISFGGGVNSVAMTIMLFKRGQVMPVVFVDTMAEHPETYCYIDYFEREFLRRYGASITRLDPYQTPEYYPNRAKGIGLEDYCIKDKCVPFLNTRFCTMDWKVAPIHAWQEMHDVTRTHIGFAWDERHRAEKKQRKAVGEKAYPLIEEGITRQGCIEAIEAEGLSIPRKSGCWFCPYQRIGQWEELYRKYPELFDRAEILERNARRKASRQNDQITLRPSGPSLEVLRDRFDGKGGDLFPDFDFEELTPCACML